MDWDYFCPGNSGNTPEKNVLEHDVQSRIMYEIDIIVYKLIRRIMRQKFAYLSKLFNADFQFIKKKIHCKNDNQT